MQKTGRTASYRSHLDQNEGTGKVKSGTTPEWERVEKDERVSVGDAERIRMSRGTRERMALGRQGPPALPPLLCPAELQGCLSGLLCKKHRSLMLCSDLRLF